MRTQRLLLLAALAVLAACTTGEATSGSGSRLASMPAEVRADYEVFAQRCSKCHALSRASESGIDDDGYWKDYVRRMRLQPASGISPEDGEVILRYLHYYSLEQRRIKAEKAGQQERVTPSPAGAP